MEAPTDRRSRASLATLFAASALAAATLLALTGSAAAATFTVSDTTNASPDSLRQAIINANANGVEDTIRISATGTIDLQSALPDIDNDTAGLDLTIGGQGMEDLNVRRDPGASTDFRIFTTAPGSEVVISDLTTSEGVAPTDIGGLPRGGGIANQGDLELLRVRVSNNQAAGSTLTSGGGIYNKFGAQLTLTDSIVSGNEATSTGNSADGGGVAQGSNVSSPGTVIISRSVLADNSVTGASGAISGGGISQGSNTTVTITDSTISGNTVLATGGNALGGGSAALASVNATATIANSTISGNTVSGGTSRGGGVYGFGALTMRNSTVTDNGGSAADGGDNLWAGNSSSATKSIESTIISDPRNGNPSCASFTDSTSLGHNLEDGDSCNFDQSSDQVDTDPQLLPLAGNGGPTETHSFPATSPAVDKGDNTAGGYANDQRGASFPRTIDFPTIADSGDGTDVGALELAVPADTPPSAVNDTATVSEDSGPTAIDVLANDTDPDGGPKSIDTVTQPANGTVVITGSGSGLTYEPDADYCNDPGPAPTDQFDYKLTPGASTATVAVTVSCVDDPPTPPPACFGERATIVATPGVPTTGTDDRDVIVGSSADDEIDGGGGQDLICAKSGEDVIAGGSDRDRIDGGPGSDDISGGGDRDRISGGSGSDKIFGGASRDKLAGNSGDDLIKGRSGRDDLVGGSGPDVLKGGSGADDLRGGGGKDVLFGNGSRDTLKGGKGPDKLKGGPGADELDGGKGSRDRCDGGPNRDSGKRCERNSDIP